MSNTLRERYAIDDLAEAAGGYFSLPTEEEIAFTDLLFDVCQQFSIHYYSATAKEKAFVEEVTRVTWARQRERETGESLSVRPAFSV